MGDGTETISSALSVVRAYDAPTWRCPDCGKDSPRLDRLCPDGHPTSPRPPTSEERAIAALRAENEILAASLKVAEATLAQRNRDFEQGEKINRRLRNQLEELRPH